MSSFDAGRSAEEKAADYLARHGFKVLDRNWSTKYCEIDIVAEKNNVIYFVEVKYRKNTNQGYGMDYITPAKLQQMQFAAEFWVSEHNWNGEYQLSVISIDGQNITFLEQL